MFHTLLGFKSSTKSCNASKYEPTTVLFTPLERTVDNFSGFLNVREGCRFFRPVHQALPGVPFLNLFLIPKVLHSWPALAVSFHFERPNPLSASFKDLYHLIFQLQWYNRGLTGSCLGCYSARYPVPKGRARHSMCLSCFTYGHPFLTASTAASIFSSG